MTVEELEAKVKAMENELQRLKDIDEIKCLQRAYGYYLEHWMAEDVIDLFSRCRRKGACRRVLWEGRCQKVLSPWKSGRRAQGTG